MTTARTLSGYDLNTLLVQEGSELAANGGPFITETEYFIFDESKNYSLDEVAKIVTESIQSGNMVSDRILLNTSERVKLLKENRECLEFILNDPVFLEESQKYKGFGESIWDFLGRVGRIINQPRPVLELKYEVKERLNTFVTRIEVLEKTIETGIDEALAKRRKTGELDVEAGRLALHNIQKRRKELSREYTTYRAALARLQRDYEIIPARSILLQWGTITKMWIKYFTAKIFVWVTAGMSMFSLHTMLGYTNIFSMGADMSYSAYKKATEDFNQIPTVDSNLLDPARMKLSPLGLYRTSRALANPTVTVSSTESTVASKFFYAIYKGLNSIGEPIDRFIDNNIGGTTFKYITYFATANLVIILLGKLVMRIQDYFKSVVSIKDIERIEKENNLMYVNYNSKLTKLKTMMRSVSLDNKSEKNYDDFKARTR